MNKMAGKEDVPTTSRIKVVCKFCNAIIGCEKGSTDLFCQHLEESHNIFQNQDMVLALQFLSETQRSELMKITRGAIRETLKVGHDGEEEDEEDEGQIFDYPRLEAAPGSKDWTLDLLRRQVSKYINNIKDYFNMLLRAFRLLCVGTKVAFITKSTRQCSQARARAFDISHILDQGTLGCQLKGETFLKIHIEI